MSLVRTSQVSHTKRSESLGFAGGTGLGGSSLGGSTIFGGSFTSSTLGGSGSTGFSSLIGSGS
jgi:hypothetical protein